LKRQHSGGGGQERGQEREQDNRSNSRDVSAENASTGMGRKNSNRMAIKVTVDKGEKTVGRTTQKGHKKHENKFQGQGFSWTPKERNKLTGRGEALRAVMVNLQPKKQRTKRETDETFSQKKTPGLGGGEGTEAE